jgi:hypothetical protein
VLHLDEDLELIAELTGQTVKRLSVGRWHTRAAVDPKARLDIPAFLPNPTQKRENPPPQQSTSQPITRWQILTHAPSAQRHPGDFPNISCRISSLLSMARRPIGTDMSVPLTLNVS